MCTVDVCFTQESRSSQFNTLSKINLLYVNLLISTRFPVISFLIPLNLLNLSSLYFRGWGTAFTVEINELNSGVTCWNHYLTTPAFCTGSFFRLISSQRVFRWESSQMLPILYLMIYFLVIRMLTHSLLRTTEQSSALLLLSGILLIDNWLARILIRKKVVRQLFSNFHSWKCLT